MLPASPAWTARAISTAASSSSGVAERLPTFSGLGLSDDLCVALEEVGLERPSATQSLAIPRLIERESIALSASTGSGKTLAYLLPMFDHLREDERQRPRVLTDGSCAPRTRMVVS